MADKEQELLEQEIATMINTIPKDGYGYGQCVSEQILAKLKSLGYVKWDREKVAQMGYEFLGIGWDKLTEASKDIFRERADQLHKILTGGE